MVYEKYLPYQVDSKEFIDKYEVLPCEPLHDVSKHIKHLFEEIPRHLNGQVKQHFEKTLNGLFEGKEEKRGCDYRKCLVRLLSCEVMQELTSDVKTIFETMSEIQRILYLSEDKKTLTDILRYNTQWFLHIYTLKSLVGDSPWATTLSERSIYGKYAHGLEHACLQLRIVSGMTSNVESQERTFKKTKNKSVCTNNHPDNVILQVFLRIEVERKMPMMLKKISY